MSRALRSVWVCVWGLSVLGAHAQEEQPDPLPQLEWGEAVYCVTVQEPDGRTREYRLQCGLQDAQPQCLRAPNVITLDGTELRMVQTCRFFDFDVDYQPLVAAGVPMLDAIAEAPPGWIRDSYGRVMQVTFDLLDRYYLEAYPGLLDGSSAKSGLIRRTTGSCSTRVFRPRGFKGRSECVTISGRSRRP